MLISTFRIRIGTMFRMVIPALTLAVLGACTEAPSWQKLLGAKISQQYPAYKVQTEANGNLLVERPGMSAMPVDVNAIAAFCLRGAKDCDYATDQMLLQLQKP
ncbi:MAG: hypothetical protein HYX42_22880 [Polaromonas sp.]|uniref:hypothetical protein n=1 Tax=Polaromonas sp. TaxID=1869339 RepID=UPI0025EB4A11|nr:hypothetical protein [Polaromonas sp.]MBI2729092.1 hypothetical protein [Polaromonas sp.]